jgi:hypothetical protein
LRVFVSFALYLMKILCQNWKTGEESLQIYDIRNKSLDGVLERKAPETSFPAFS